LAQYKRIVLDKRPVADFEPDTFKTELVPFNLKPGHTQALVQCTYLSLDPAMRGYVRDVRSYMPPVQIGETMRAMCLGVVTEAGPGSSFKPGDRVTGSIGMTEYAVVDDEKLNKIDPIPGTIALDYLGVLGLTGMTAYFGLTRVGELKAGETLVVSGAAGATGAVTCQLGKHMGAKVYAIAGTEEKCDWLENECGVEKAFNYKSPTFRDDFKKTAKYFDVYFDNVGGEILDFMLTRLNKNARIALCGAISAYNSPSPKGLQAYTNLISQRGKIQGFIIHDYESEFHVAYAELAKGLSQGHIKRKFHIVEGGIEQAPVALPLLFSGGNDGKLVVKVSEDPDVAKAVL